MRTDTQTSTNTAITTTVRELRQILTGLGKVLGKHPPDHALGCVRIIVDGSGAADIAATDGDTWASIRLPETAAGGQAEFLVPVIRLKELLKPASPGDTITLSQNSDGCQLSCGSRSKTLKAPPASAYPRSPAFTGKAHTLPPGAKRAIVEALRCASTDKTRQVINGINFDTTGKGHHIVGTDGRHLYTANSFKLPLTQPAILAYNRLFDWKPINDATEWKFRQIRDKNSRGGSYELTAGVWRITGRLIDGDYPSWRQVIPGKTEHSSGVRFDPEKVTDLAPTVAKLPVLSLNSGNHPVVVRSDGRVVELLWKEAADEPYQDLPIPGARSSGKPFTITIDRKYLAKAFAFGFEEMRVADELSPARFSDSNGRQLVVMPQRPTGGLPPARQKNETKPEPEHQPTTDTPKMPKQEHPRNTTRPAPASTTAPIDEALAELASVRDTLRNATSGLSTAAAKLKQAKQEQRTADKEIRSVRSTIESLRKVHL